MKAVRLHAKGDLRIEDVPPPAPPPGWARMRVTLAGICGSDLHNFRTGQWITRAPSIAGHEFTGVVLEAGSRLQPGDRVVGDSRFWCGACPPCRAGRHQLCHRLGFVGEACDGCFAEQIALPEKLLWKVPESLPPEIAVTAEPFAVALHAVRRLNPRAGEPVLIAGCGPIGGFAGVILAHLGQGPILVADHNAQRAEQVARATGATVVALQSARDHDLRWAIDATGSIAALRSLMACLSGGATIALVGICHGTLDLDPNILVERELNLIGCHAFHDEMPGAIALLPACADRVRHLLDREITLDGVPDAYLRIASGQSAGLKTLIRP